MRRKKAKRGEHITEGVYCKTCKGMIRVVTMKDVAEKAGVSEATVSRVLSGRPNVSMEMRMRVLEVADTLGYVPNLAARALVQGKELSSYAGGEGVGVIVSSAALKFSHAFFSEILDAIDEELESHGKWIAYVKDSEEVQENSRMVNLMTPQYVEGLVFMGNRASFPFLERAIGQRLPVVLIGFNVAGQNSILFDKENGTKEIINHLVQLGHSNIAYIGGNDERRGTFIECLRRHKLPIKEEWILNTQWCSEHGYETTRQLFGQQGPRPTAVVAGCDTIAVGVLRAVYDCGLEVPRDVSVTGFDDLNISQYMIPSLTTVRVYRKDIGQFAARRILDELSGKSEANMVARSPVKLITRESTGPCGD